MPRISPERLEEIRELHGSFSSIQDLFAHIDALEAEKKEYTAHYDRLFDKGVLIETIKYSEMIDERNRLKERVTRLREALGKIGQDDWRYHEVAQQALAADDEMQKLTSVNN